MSPDEWLKTCADAHEAWLRRLTAGLTDDQARAVRDAVKEAENALTDRLLYGSPPDA